MEKGTTAATGSDRRIVELLRLSEGLERADLAELLELPAPTVASAVGRLVRRGAVTETTARPRGKVGRPARLLHLTGPTPVVAVVAWSDTGIHAEIGTYGARRLVQQDWVGDTELAEAMGWVVRAVPPEHALTAVVVGMAAPFTPGSSAAAERATTERYAGVASRSDAAAPAFAVRVEGDPAGEWSQRVGVPVHFVNDANLAALGERSAGSGRGARDLLYVKIAAHRVGAGLIIDGRLHRGASGFAGELAHIHVDDNGPLCVCGGRGCLSSRVAAGLVADVEAVYGRRMTFDEVLTLADRGERAPQRALEDIGRTVGRPLADLVTFLDPGLIVLDGGLGPAGRFVAASLREQLDRYAAPPAATAVEIRFGSLSDLTDLHGAIALCRSEVRGSR